jgi:hypothetical protein
VTNLNDRIQFDIHDHILLRATWTARDAEPLTLGAGPSSFGRKTFQEAGYR